MTHDLTRDPIAKGIALFALPLLGTSVAQQLYGTVDLIFVGNVLGPDAMAALGISIMLITCLIGFFGGVSVGVNVVVAQCVGEASGAKTDRAIGTSLVTGLVGGIALALVGYALAPLYLTWMATPAGVVDMALVYLRVYFLSMVSVVMYNQCAGILRGLGDSRTPLLAQVVGGLCNIAANAALLVALGMGVEGSALATLVSQTVAALICVRAIVRHGQASSGVAAKAADKAAVPAAGASARPLRALLAFDPALLRRILVVGVPAGLQSLVITLSNVFVQHQINLLGTDAIAAFSVYYKVELPIYYALVSIGQAATTFVAQNCASRLDKRAHDGTRTCLAMGVGTAIVLAVALVAFGHEVFWLFTQDEQVIELGRGITRITFPFYWVYAFMEVYAAAMRGRGNSVVPMAVIMLNVFGLRTTLLFALTAQGVTAGAIAVTYPITWTASALAMMACYHFLVVRRAAARG